MFETWADGLKFALGTAAAFAIVGGIVSQTSGGVSGRGFWEGMWKGIEWWFIALAIVGIIIGGMWVLGFTANQLNTNW